METDSSLVTPQAIERIQWSPPIYTFPSSKADSKSKLLFTNHPRDLKVAEKQDQPSEPTRKKRKLNFKGSVLAKRRENLEESDLVTRWDSCLSPILKSFFGPLLFDSSSTSSKNLKHQFSIQSPTPLLDAVWYPFASKEDPSTWCFAISSRDTPVKLIDASSAKIRATYGIMDHVERFIGPQCLTFSLDGTRLYGGHFSKLFILPISTPGLNVHHLHSLPSQKGIISSISISLDHETGSEILAIGTFSGNTGIYSLDFGGWNSEFDPDRSGNLVCLKGWREENGSGVSQVAFHPLNPNLLFVTSRKSENNSIILYDLNQVNEKPRFGLLAGQRTKSKSVGNLAVMARFLRRNKKTNSAPSKEKELDDTNNRTAEDKKRQVQDEIEEKEEQEKEEKEKVSQQRLFFSIDWSGRWLIAGNRKGTVNAWKIDQYAGSNVPDDLHEDHADSKEMSENFEFRREEGGSTTEADFIWEAHNDAITSVSIHPLFSYLLTTSGSRHWEAKKRPSRKSKQPSSSDSDSESDSSSDVDKELLCRTFDSSLKIWDLN